MSSLIFDCPLLFPVRFAHRWPASLAAREPHDTSEAEAGRALVFRICMSAARVQGMKSPAAGLRAVEALKEGLRFSRRCRIIIKKGG